jgi:uncharacterized protein
MKITDQQRLLEITAVILTGLGKFLFMDLLNWRFAYITTAVLCWVGYVYYRARQNNSSGSQTGNGLKPIGEAYPKSEQHLKNGTILTYWGLSTKGFKKTFLELLPFAIFSVLLFLFIGNQRGTNVLNWHIIPILLLYPIWGIIQQFIIVALIARNMSDMERIRIPEVLVVVVTALVFALVHFPFLILVGATFLLAIVYTSLYLRGRNLLVLGLYHGWLGAVFFYTVLGRDAWREVFG